MKRLVVCLVVSCATAWADDYRAVESPRLPLPHSEESEPYQKPRNPAACSIFLENLQYFARRSEPLSCGQPVAPKLAHVLRRVEWQDLDPDQHSDLLKTLLWGPGAKRRDPATEARIRAERADDIRRKVYVFRRAKLELKGYPLLRSNPGNLSSEISFQIVQFGFNVTDPENPDASLRCHWTKGRVMTSVPGPRMYIVSDDLAEVYSDLNDWVSDPQNLWRIDGYPYGEAYSETGEVRLSELRLESPAHLEPVCLYYFQNRPTR